jgi:ABC-type lipoprotein release transport system permease subunit
LNAWRRVLRRAYVRGRRRVASLLYEVSPADPLALLGPPVVLAVVAALACVVPAWRASRVAPATALRAD